MSKFTRNILSRLKIQIKAAYCKLIYLYRTCGNIFVSKREGILTHVNEERTGQKPLTWDDAYKGAVENGIKTRTVCALSERLGESHSKQSTGLVDVSISILVCNIVSICHKICHVCFCHGCHSL